jgi:hypothetical protein
MARVSVSVFNEDVENENGRFVDGTVLTCDKCGHRVEVLGSSDSSIGYGFVKMREECPNSENNFYY